jgi:hypothetical protein
MEKRRKGWLEPSLDTVHQAKSDLPVPKDVIKAAGNFQGVAPTYNQAYRALTSKTSLQRLHDVDYMMLRVISCCNHISRSLQS